MILNKIQEDNRGSIFILEGLSDFSELKLIKTNKGYARGGCVHSQNEYFYILEGKLDLFIGSEIYKNISSGFGIIISAYQPHYIVSLTDSIFMEYGADFEGTIKNEEFLQIVKGINEKI